MIDYFWRFFASLRCAQNDILWWIRDSDSGLVLGVHLPLEDLGVDESAEIW